MAEHKATLLIELKDKGTAILGFLKNQFMSLGVSVAALTAFMVSSIKSYMESETAVNKLNESLKSQGIYTDRVSKHLQEYAAQLQATSTFSDEAALGVMSTLTSFGLYGEKLKETTRAAMDLSSGLGIDLTSAAMLLGKAFSGNVATLSRYGIKINENVGITEKFDAVLKQVGDRWGGRAQGDLNTFAGKLANLGNKFDDLKESVGKMLMPYADKFLNWAGSAVKVIDKLIGPKTQLQVVSKKLGDAIRELTEAEQVYSIIGTARLQKTQEEIASMRAKVDALREQQRALAEAAQEDKARLEEDLKQKALHNTAEVQFDVQKYMEKLAAVQGFTMQAEFLTIQHYEKELRQQGRYSEASLLMEKYLAKRRQDMARDAFANLSVLASAKSRTLAGIGKASGIAAATISTYQAAAGALATPPVGPWNFALAASMIVAGLANVAHIAGVEFAEGGMVNPRSGGVHAILGEAGKREVVIPLGDSKTKAALRDTLGGNSTGVNIGSINISVSGDLENGKRELLRDLAEEIKDATTDAITFARRSADLADKYNDRAV